MTDRPGIAAALLVAVAALGLVSCVAWPGEFGDADDSRLRVSLRAVDQLQTVRPPAMLERAFADALRSIREIEGRTDPPLAGALASRIKEAWGEIERARALQAAGYLGVNEAPLEAGEARLQEVLSQFARSRAPYPADTYRLALNALSEVTALGRAARRHVGGLRSDDVAAIREKRQRLLLREPEGEEQTTGRFVGIELTRDR